MKLFPTIRRLIQVVGGGASGFIASLINAGIQLGNRFSLIAGTASLAVAIDITRQEFRGPIQTLAIDIDVQGVTGAAASPAHTPAIATDASLRDVAATSTQQNPALSFAQKEDIAWTTPTQLPAFDIDLTGAAGAAVNEAHTPAMDIDASLRDAAAANVSQVPSFDIVRIQYDLNRRVGGVGATNITGTWTGLANSQGRQDGSDATSTGAVSAASRKLRLDYDNHLSKSGLTISSVLLHLYIQSAGNTAGLLGSVTFSYDIGAGEVIPAAWNARTDTFDFTTTPNTIDITAEIGGDWAKINNLRTFVLHTYAALSATFVISVDAIEVEIVAATTQTP